MICYLDFDGPLFSDKVILFHPDNRKDYPGDPELANFMSYWKMDDVVVSFLNHVSDCYDTKFVISSAWRKCLGFKGRKESFEDLFETNGLKIQLHDDWCTRDFSGYREFHYRCSRAEEIHDHIQRNGIEKFVVLDDPMSGSSLDDSGCHAEFDPTHKYIADRTVLVNVDTGLGAIDCKQLLKLCRG